MAETSKIEWTDSTFNPWIGCTKISPACDHCYAEAQMDTRMGRVQWGAGNPRSRTSAAYWKQPLRWNAERFVECGDCGYRGKPALAAVGAMRAGDEVCCAACFSRRTGPARRRVFCSSLADVFDNEVDPEWRADLFELIAATPNLDWLLLTKRIGNAREMMEIAGTVARLKGAEWPLPNVWLGATICNQAEADRDIPKLLATPAAKRFLSIEPMLGDIRLGQCLQLSPSAAFTAGKITADMPAWTRIGSTAIDWIICGGESGPHARPMHPDWARSLRDQCAVDKVPFLFKQWGEWAPYRLHVNGDLGGDLRSGKVQHLHAPGNPEGFFRKGDAYVERVGKHAAGRLLDGVEHNGVPT